MSGHNVKILALIYEQVAIMEALKAANACRADIGSAPAYDDSAFYKVAEELQRLAGSTES